MGQSQHQRLQHRAVGLDPLPCTAHTHTQAFFLRRGRNVLRHPRQQRIDRHRRQHRLHLSGIKPGHFQQSAEQARQVLHGRIEVGVHLLRLGVGRQTLQAVDEQGQGLGWLAEVMGGRGPKSCALCHRILGLR